MAVELIILTQFGDFLRPDPNSKVLGNSSLDEGIKWHGAGCCTLSIQKVSDAFSRIVCKCCGTIVVIPNTITTYQELRDWCEKQLRAQRSRRSAVDDAIMQTARIGSASDDDIFGPHG